ncbi:putative Inner membrane protein YidH [metagenome]|uniref:Putative Inner membrane protein YidH n=1 Tax=metagenome TaxID=256318 RepID=A0A2P2C6B1_9ZZZZ
MTAPDPRYGLANERTYLAWVRTSLGLIAASAGLNAIDTGWPQWAESTISAVLAAAAVSCTVLAWWRWRGAKAAIAEGRDLPDDYGHVILTVVITGVALAVLLLVLR